jgi:hypothetical protein
MTVSFIAFGMLAIAADPMSPMPKLPLGKATTYFEKPLNTDGTLDYSAALNERLQGKSTPQSNFVVALWLITGPEPESRPMPAGYWTALGIGKPDPDRAMYVGRESFFNQRKYEIVDSNRFTEQQAVCGRAPWSRVDSPDISEWIEVNNPALSAIILAAKRPDYFHPIVPTTDGETPKVLISAFLTNSSVVRVFANLLQMRAMRSLAAKEFDDAWQDIMTMHRIARHQSRGAMMIESLVGIAVESIAIQATLRYLEHAPLSAAQIQARWAEIEALPTWSPLADKIDLGERCLYLDGMQILRTGKLSSFDNTAKSLPEHTIKALDTIDWAPILKDGNTWYDAAVTAARMPTVEKRRRAIHDLEIKLRKAHAKKLDTSLLKDAFTVLDLSGKAKVQQHAERMIHLMMPSISKVLEAEDRRTMSHEMQRVAFALAGHFADHKTYPTSLDALVPKYIKTIPGDGFSGTSLLYKPDAKGYVLYSVGPNGKDDDARTRDDLPNGDDLVLRQPYAPPRVPEMEQ